MRLSLLAASFAVTSLATAQTSFLSEEQRQEIRTLIREEIRAALKEHAAQATTVQAAPAKTHGSTAADPTTGTTKTKAFRVTDGKVQEVEVNLGELVDEQDSFRVLTQRDGQHYIQIVRSAEPQGSTRIVTLSPKVVAGNHKVAVVAPEGVEQKALAECCKALEAAEECCEAVEVVVEKGEGTGSVVEVEAKPAKVKAKKNKKGAKKNKAPKVEKVDAGTELKISEVPEKVSR